MRNKTASGARRLFRIASALIVFSICCGCGKARQPLLTDNDVVGLYTTTFQDLTGTLRVRSDGTYCETMRDRVTGNAVHSGGWERWRVNSREPEGSFGSVLVYELVFDNWWGFYEVPGFPRQKYASSQLMLEKWLNDETHIVIGNRHADFWTRVNKDPDGLIP